MLASSVVDGLRSNISARTSEQIPACYFFFKDDNETQASAAYAFYRILHQLIFLDGHLITAVMDEYRSKGGRFLDDCHSLWEDFINTVSTSKYKRIVCVLHVLDECSTRSRDHLIRSIVDTIGDCAESTKAKSHARLKLLSTSRPLASIEKFFSKISHIQFKIGSGTEVVERHIDKVITTRIDAIGRDKNLPPEV